MRSRLRGGWQTCSREPLPSSEHAPSGPPCSMTSASGIRGSEPSGGVSPPFGTRSDCPCQASSAVTATMAMRGRTISSRSDRTAWWCPLHAFIPVLHQIRNSIASGRCSWMQTTRDRHGSRGSCGAERLRGPDICQYHGHRHMIKIHKHTVSPGQMAQPSMAADGRRA